MKSFLQYTGLATLCALSLGANAKVHEYQLDNGLRILVKEDHRAPVVVSEVWYKIGSSYEPLGITGISHMLEHMMFKGTKKLARELPQSSQKMAVNKMLSLPKISPVITKYLKKANCRLVLN